MHPNGVWYITKLSKEIIYSDSFMDLRIFKSWLFYHKMFLCTYRKSGNFHVEIIHVVNIHVDLFLWVFGTHENILT